MCRAISGDPRFTSLELFVAQSNGHKFTPNQKCTLVGLMDFPEFNGQEVVISSIREDGARGRSYYINGEINKFVNWVYEYRLAAKE